MNKLIFSAICSLSVMGSLIFSGCVPPPPPPDNNTYNNNYYRDDSPRRHYERDHRPPPPPPGRHEPGRPHHKHDVRPPRPYPNHKDHRSEYLRPAPDRNIPSVSVKTHASLDRSDI